MPEYLTASELGKLLRLSREKILVMARKGQIPAMRLSPKTIRFNPDAVAAALSPKREGRA
ncbi:MAG: helix-turn-helix domain-containing protein [Phycisphaerae bacterium]